MERSGRNVGEGGRKEIRIMLGNDSWSKMPTSRKKYFHTFPTIFLLKKWLPIHWDNFKRWFSSVFQSLYILVLVDLYSTKEWSKSVFLSVFVGYRYIATLNCPNLLTTAFLELCALLVLAVLSWYIFSASLIYFLGAQNLASLQMFGWAQP